MSRVNLTTGFAAVENGELLYQVAGQGTPLVLVHAGIADHTMWDAQFEAFAEHYHVIRYDMRGFGKSQAAQHAFSHHEDLSRLLADLKIDKAHLLGASNGGACVIDFALHYPNNVLSLSLMSSAVSGYAFQGAPPAPLMNLFAALERGDWEHAAKLAAQVWVDGPKRSPKQVNQEVRHHVKQMSVPALANMNPAVIQPSPLDPPALQRLHEITAPTHVMVGDCDDDSVLGIAEQLSQGIRKSQKIIFDDVAHMLNMEKPEQFNQVVLEFLKSVND